MDAPGNASRNVMRRLSVVALVSIAISVLAGVSIGLMAMRALADEVSHQPNDEQEASLRREGMIYMTAFSLLFAAVLVPSACLVVWTGSKRKQRSSE
jgi:hypothetical protein